MKKLSFQLQRSVLEDMGLSGGAVPGWVEEYFISYYIEGTEDTLGTDERKSFDDAMKAARKNVGWNSSTDSIYDKATQVGKESVLYFWYEYSLQNCSDLILTVSWQSYSSDKRQSHNFFKSSITPTDYGVCCSFHVHMDFDKYLGDPVKRSRVMDKYNYPGKPSPILSGYLILLFLFSVSDFEEIKRGHFRNGLRNGLHVTADVEVYEYNTNMRASKGINLALADPRDRPILRQNGRAGTASGGSPVFTCSRSIPFTWKRDTSLTTNFSHKCHT